jgi:hypothetical protein
MRNPIETERECLACVRELLWELATELELHYEEEDFFALHDTAEKMKGAADLLHARGIDLPADVVSIMAKLDRNTGLWRSEP